MCNRNFTAALLAALVLGLGAGHAVAGETDSSMEASDASGMSGSMEDESAAMGDSMKDGGMKDGGMEDAGGSSMSGSMGDDSGMSGDMDDEASSMGDDM